MAVLKIGVVEDELIIARTIIDTLNELGYSHCGPAISYTEALKMLADNKPDLLLLDINLSGRKDGIDVAEKVNELYQLPFIFLTANSDMQTIERAKKVKPHAYIVKPFTKEELFAAIEIAFSNFTGSRALQKGEHPVSFNMKDAMFVKDGYQFHKVYFRDIIYLESDHNYVTIFLIDKPKLVIRSPFVEFLSKLPPAIFLQVHRSYAINLDHVDTLELTEVIVKGNKIPIGKTQRDELMKRLGIVE